MKIELLAELRKRVWFAIAFSLILAIPALATAQTVWTGPTVRISKAAFADPTLPANQDVILPEVLTLTRASTQGFYNAVSESGWMGHAVSPADTEWAFQANNPTETVASSNFAALDFAPWSNAHGGNPIGVVGEPSVVHIISADIYLDLTVTAWGGGIDGGGSYTYERSTPGPARVPAGQGLGPAILLMALCLTCGIALRAQSGDLA